MLLHFSSRDGHMTCFVQRNVKNHVGGRGLKSTCVNGLALAFVPLPLPWEHAYPSFLEDKRRMPSQLFQSKASEIKLRVSRYLKTYVSQAWISRGIYVTNLDAWIMKLLLYVDEVLFVWLVGCLLCNITVTIDVWYRYSHEFLWGSPKIMGKYLTCFFIDEENHRHFYAHGLPFHSPAPRQLEKLPDYLFHNLTFPGASVNKILRKSSSFFLLVCLWDTGNSHTILTQMNTWSAI